MLHKETADRTDCKWVEGLSDDKLAWLINTPALSGELLDHALFCRRCAERIQSVTDAEAALLSEQERTACDRWAEQFVREGFGAGSAPQAPHPSLARLVLLKAGLLSKADAPDVYSHVEDGCGQCSRLLASSWLRAAAAAVVGGAVTVEWLARMGPGPLLWRVHVPADSMSYADTDEHEPAFSARFGGADFSVVLEEMESDELFVRVAARGGAPESRRVHVEIIGEAQTLQAELELEDEGGVWAGVHYFQGFGEAKGKLGAATVLVAPTVAGAAPGE